MATVTKDFRVKAGLVVEGSTATVNSHDILTEALVDAKGDLLVASGADAVTRLAVGTDNYVLTADSNATNGVAWKAPAAVGVFESSITFEGSTADDYETTLQVTDPTADRTITLPNASGTVALTTDITVSASSTNTFSNKSIALSSNTVTGSISDFNSALTDADFATIAGAETLTNKTLTTPVISSITNGAATLTLPTSTGTVALTSDIPSLSGYVTESGVQTLTNKTLTGPVVSGLTLSDGSFVVEGSTANEFETTVQFTDPTQDRTITIPNVTGTVVTSGDTGSVTNTMLAGSIANDKLSNSSITINGFSISLGGSATYGTDNINEGSTNKYFTDERAQDAVGLSVGNGLDYDDGTGAISVDPSEFALSAVGAPTGDVSMATHKITGLGTPTNSTDAATKAYVDSVTEGLHIHEAARAATTANVALATALENGDVLDGVTLVTGDRILVKNQTTQSENGIYIVQASGQPTRATDFDTATEVDSGDFIFVYSGTVNASTGWVQTNKPATIGTDPIVFTQFSGAGTYLAGNGLTLTGNSFSIDTAITADLSTAQTLTNKTLTSPTISGTVTVGGAGNFTISSDSDIVLNPGANVYIESATAGNEVVTIGGTQTLTNKTLTSPTISGLTLSDGSIVLEGATANAHETTITVTDPTADRTITLPDATGTVALTNNKLDVFAATTSTELASVISDETGSGALVFGTSPTLTTPNIGAATATSITLADALMGSALATASDSATVIDSWSASTYSSAKYIVQMKKGSDIEVIEVLVTIDGSNNVYITEYADVISNAVLGTTDADYSGGNVRLLVTGTTSDTSVKVHKTYIEA